MSPTHSSKQFNCSTFNESEWMPQNTNLEKGESTIKRVVHPKMKILSSFTHHHVIPNLM